MGPNTETELSEVLGNLGVDITETGEKGGGAGYDEGYDSHQSGGSDETELEPLSIREEEREEQCVVQCVLLYRAKGLTDQRYTPYEKRTAAVAGPAANAPV